MRAILVASRKTLNLYNPKTYITSSKFLPRFAEDVGQQPGGEEQPGDAGEAGRQGRSLIAIADVAPGPGRQARLVVEKRDDLPSDPPHG